jgi:hypothetical protein
MSPQLQTAAALLIVAAAATWLLVRSFSKRTKPGCGGGCGCPSTEIRSKLRGQDKAAGTRA